MRLDGRRGVLMGIDGIASGKSLSAGLPLVEAYRVLNDRRMEIDRRMSSMAEDDPAREVLWQSLQLVMDELREVVTGLARSQAIDLPGLQAKAGILAGLLRAPCGGGPIIPETERMALALSLADDIARFTAG
jgi:hypothetical protein